MEFTISRDDAGKSIDTYLKMTKKFSHRCVCRAKFGGEILVNGKSAFTSHILNENDILVVNIKENENKNVVASSDKMPDILYEDNHIIAVNKPPHIPTHPSRAHFDDTLANAVAGYFEKTHTDSAVRILGRLDKDTSGVVIICKNRYICKLMNETKTEKTYLAMCDGIFTQKSGTINLPIERKSEGSMERCVTPGGKPAVTQYNVLCENEKFSFVKINLKTGRTHQIRVHMSHIGHPLVGDALYGKGEFMPRQALHARSVSFVHPIYNTDICISAPLPPDFKCFAKENFDITDLKI